MTKGLQHSHSGRRLGLQLNFSRTAAHTSSNWPGNFGPLFPDGTKFKKKIAYPFVNPVQK